MGGKWTDFENLSGASLQDEKLVWIAGKVHEFFFTFYESKATEFQNVVADLKSQSKLLQTLIDSVDQNEDIPAAYTEASSRFEKLKSEKLESKSIARVVIEFPYYHEQFHTNLIRLTDRSDNLFKLNAIIMVLDRCFYVSTQGAKNVMGSLSDKTYLTRLLDEDPCGSLDKQGREGSKTQRVNCCSSTSVVSIYDAQIPEKEEGVQEVLKEFEMNVVDNGGLNIRESQSKDSGVFLLQGEPDDDDEKEGPRFAGI
jgi:hypothetical protein